MRREVSRHRFQLPSGWLVLHTRVVLLIDAMFAGRVAEKMSQRKMWIENFAECNIPNLGVLRVLLRVVATLCTVVFARKMLHETQ